MTFTILWLLLSLFLGFAIGRFSHTHVNDWVGNPSWTPHHWIWGVIITVAGILLRHAWYGWYAAAFGVGLFISDLKDFLLMRFFRPDDPGPKRFWHID